MSYGTARASPGNRLLGFHLKVRVGNAQLEQSLSMLSDRELFSLLIIIIISSTHSTCEVLFTVFYPSERASVEGWAEDPAGDCCNVDDMNGWICIVTSRHYKTPRINKNCQKIATLRHTNDHEW